MSIDDFQFRFSLDDVQHKEVDEENPLTQMIYHFLNDLQQIGYLCCNNKRVHIDGFVLNNEPETLHPLSQEPSEVERG